KNKNRVAPALDFADAIDRLRAAQGDPEKLTLATVSVILTAHPQLEPVFETAAVPHWFDANILAALLEADNEKAHHWLAELKILPMVEEYAARGGWNVHEATRLALRNRMSASTPERFRMLSARAAACFAGDEPPMRVESLYHRLISVPEEAARELDEL